MAFDLGANLAMATNNTVSGLGFTSKLCEGDRRSRSLIAMRWFDSIIRLHNDRFNQLECVIYERPFARGEHATRALWGLAGILEAVALAQGLTALDVPPTKIKQWATGKGMAGKDMMMVAAKRMGYNGDNEHEADAFCLLRYAEANVIEGNE